MYRYEATHSVVVALAVITIVDKNKTKTSIGTAVVKRIPNVKINAGIANKIWYMLESTRVAVELKIPSISAGKKIPTVKPTIIHISCGWSIATPLPPDGLLDAIVRIDSEMDTIAKNNIGRRYFIFPDTPMFIILFILSHNLNV